LDKNEARSVSEIASNQESEAADVTERKPIWQKALGITSKFQEAETKDMISKFGKNGSQLALLFPGERIDMAYFKGKRDFLLLTAKRLIHVDGQKASGIARLAGDKGKVTYTTYPWRHIAEFKTTTLGASEAFSLNQETELDVKLSNDQWLHFEFKKEVDILKVNRYFSEKLLWAEPLVYGDLPVLSPANLLTYTADTTGRLSQISYDALPDEVNKVLTKGERKLVAFSYKKMMSVKNKDYVLVTNKRIVDVDRRGMKKVELSSKPFSPHLRDAICAISVTTAGGYDLDSEMSVDVFGVGRSEADLTRETDVLKLYKNLNEWVLA
jgi:hypothetical protein